MLGPGAKRTSCFSRGYQNPSGLEFCGNCGSALARRCPSCGFDDPTPCKFCGECGAAILALALRISRDNLTWERRGIGSELHPRRCEVVAPTIVKSLVCGLNPPALVRGVFLD